MFIIMCGLPKSGKTTVSKKLFASNECVLRPEDWCPSGLDNLSPDKAERYRIASWETSLEITRDAITSKSSNEIIVLDQCNANYYQLATTISLAKDRGHVVVLLYVNCNSDECVRRSNNRINHILVDNYSRMILNSLKDYNTACDFAVVVNNNGTFEELDAILVGVVDKLCQNTRI